MSRLVGVTLSAVVTLGFVIPANLIVLCQIKTPCEIMFVLSTLDGSKGAELPIPRVRLYSPLDC